MSHYGTVVFLGGSRVAYRFRAWPLQTRFRTVAAVYVITRREHTNSTFRNTASHECLRIGQTADLAHLAPHGDDAQRGANCICVSVVHDAGERRAIEQDLLASNLTASLSLPPAIGGEQAVAPDGAATGAAASARRSADDGRETSETVI
jgi:hypothetical protein